MTTYQKGHEPAGAPVTWEFDDWSKRFTLWNRQGEIVAKEIWSSLESIESICAAFHAAAEWRKLAEEAVWPVESGDYVTGDGGVVARAKWLRRFDAMKETFGD